MFGAFKPKSQTPELGLSWPGDQASAPDGWEITMSSSQFFSNSALHGCWKKEMIKFMFLCLTNWLSPWLQRFLAGTFPWPRALPGPPASLAARPSRSPSPPLPFPPSWAPTPTPPFQPSQSWRPLWELSHPPLRAEIVKDSSNKSHLLLTAVALRDPTHKSHSLLRDKAL